MYCQKCGNKLGEESKFCNACGNPIGVVSQPTKKVKPSSEVDVNIEKVRKNLKNTGNSVYALGWVMLVLSIVIFLWSILDKKFFEIGLLALSLSGTSLNVIGSGIFIVLGSRIRKGEDKNIYFYLKILLLVSLVLIVSAFSVGGAPGLIFLLVVIYILSSLTKVRKAMKSEIFKTSLLSIKYRLDKKWWVIYAVVSVIFLGVSCYVDVSRENMKTLQEVTTPTSQVPSVPQEQNTVVSLEDELRQESNELNKGLPSMVNDSIELYATSVEGNELTYFYRFIGGQTMTQSQIDNDFGSTFVQKACTNPNGIPFFDRGARLIYSFHDENKKYLGKLSVHLTDCK